MVDCGRLLRDGTEVGGFDTNFGIIPFYVPVVSALVRHTWRSSYALSYVQKLVKLMLAEVVVRVLYRPDNSVVQDVS